MARPPPPRLTRPPAALINRGRGSFLANLLLAVSSHCRYYARLTCARREVQRSRVPLPVAVSTNAANGRALPSPCRCKSFYTPQQVVAFRCYALTLVKLHARGGEKRKFGSLKGLNNQGALFDREKALVLPVFRSSGYLFSHFSRGKVTFKEGLRRGWYEGDMC